MAGENTVIANMLYLEGHGLIKAHVRRRSDGTPLTITAAPLITSRGLDFLEDDGGLSAIMGIVTIKIHDDQIRLMLASRIQESSASDEQKKKWLHQLHEIPGEATKHLIHKLIDAGLAQWPAVLAAMQTLAK